MKSPFVKLAIAAVVVIAAVLVVLPMLGGKPAFAQVIKPLLNARTVTFDFVLGEDPSSPGIHDIVVGNRVRRTIPNIPVTMIIDVDSGKMLTLDEPSKSAAYIDIQGQVQEGTQSILKLVRDIVQKIADHPQDAQDLGERQIDGRSTVGYLVNTQHEKLQIWADAKKATPVRIELYGNQSVVVLKNIEFDIQVDDSLVSMDPPAGYTVKEASLKMGDFTEEEFVLGLKIWAQALNGGTFPDTITAALAMEQVAGLPQKLEVLKPSAEEGMKMGIAFGKIPGFLIVLDHQGEWHYVGKGVTFGDAKKAVFWYRRGDAKTYRAIYGDLRVEDVDLDHLPK